MIAVATPATGLIEALERLAATPSALVGLLIVGVLIVSAVLLVRGALGR